MYIVILMLIYSIILRLLDYIQCFQSRLVNRDSNLMFVMLSDNLYSENLHKK